MYYYGRGRAPVDVLFCNNVRRGASNAWCFPRKVEKVLKQLTAGQQVLQLFGGRSSWGTRLDLDPIVRPDVVGDAWLPPFSRDSFDVVILDPPYHRLNAQERVALCVTAAWIARAHLIWFDTPWMDAPPSCTLEKAWLVRVGAGAFCRCLEVFRVAPVKPDPPAGFVRGPAMKYNRWLAQPAGLPFG